ncbi:GNAT family N-acetyltransferase [Kribbella sp. NBC_00382]|uniref:GNAT family N-acetyltransferase n=1 Tax=Kribbella sp. NBC_00382 TaxID=2975967 RepID=UPI002E242E46
MLYIREPAAVAVVPPPPGVLLREPSPTDTEALGRLYYEAYNPPVVDNETAGIEDIRLTFEGTYGPLSLAGSRLAFAAGASDEAPTLIGAVLVVDRAPWPGTPDCPFIIEAFTSPAWRRKGLATALLTECMTQSPVRYALNVLPDNTAAVKLYEVLGFQPG